MAADKRRSNEDEYFARLDADLLRTTRQMETAKAQEAERKLHLMKCPKDGHDLASSELHGVQIDLCVHCGGFWLDKGELEVLVKHEEHGLLSRVFQDVRAALARTRGSTGG